MNMTPTDQALFEAAERVRALAHVPYSKFHVGAAILADDGVIYAGCTVETAAYPAAGASPASSSPGRAACRSPRAAAAASASGNSPISIRRSSAWASRARR